MAKVTFKNGSSIEFKGLDDPKIAGRGINTQEFEIEVAGKITKINVKEVEKSWLEHCRDNSLVT